jgi:hypothetical protein
MFVRFLKIIDYLKFKANQIYLEPKKKFKMWYPYVNQKKNLKKYLNL